MNFEYKVDVVKYDIFKFVLIPYPVKFTCSRACTVIICGGLYGREHDYFAMDLFFLWHLERTYI